MSGSEALLPVGKEAADRLIRTLAGKTAANRQNDPIEAQRALCAAASQLVQADRPELAQLEALFALEIEGQSVSKLLLTRYVEGDSGLRPFDWRTWQAAIRLGQAFHNAHEHFLRHIRSTNDRSWAKYEPLILVQLFHHRKVEFLLRFLRYKKRNAEQWRELHTIYLLANDADLSDRVADGDEADAASQCAKKLEQQYLQILLLEAMNSGQFSPREALWAHRWFARWCNGPGMHLARIDGGSHLGLSGFVVDLCSTDGLKRTPVVADKLLYLDSSPLCAMIDQEIASLNDSATLLPGITPAVRVGQLALLYKFSVLFAPIAPEFERRGERNPIDMTVQAIAGFPCIVDALRREKKGQIGGGSQIALQGNEIAVSSFGGQIQGANFAESGGSGPASLSMTGMFAAIPQSWQVKDRSDSGCRMRGQIDNLNRVIPGSLIAIRDNATAPWIVSVVRRFRRLMVDHVEIGVEYLGRKPRFVKLVANFDSSLSNPEMPNAESRCFAALFLPPSEQIPTMPIKTLLLPAREFRAGSVVTLLSSNATYRMRLKEPLQQQFEFVLTSFSVIEKTAPQALAVRRASEAAV